MSENYTVALDYNEAHLCIKSVLFLEFNEETVILTTSRKF